MLTACCGVYPRACGGTAFRLQVFNKLAGLSPRLRGNVAEARAAGFYPGSIPALAGERKYHRPNAYLRGVYPRACGGTAFMQSLGWQCQGLSPRLRGNVATGVDSTTGVGSIPALAGERIFTCFIPKSSWVYPRACGGTSHWGKGAPRRWGLSPRLRGNVSHRPSCGPIERSIPALAGERRRRIGFGPSIWVYPRACGGTRGAARPSVGAWVYPRACGGTANFHRIASRSEGLSPRLRGNVVKASTSTSIIRSIPALAGERFQDMSFPLANRVYPRACGGTQRRAIQSASRRGLSPRLRGNVVSVGGV